MNNEELMSKINEGRHAAVCLQWMGPLFETCEKNIIANLKNSYRMGKYTEVVLASGIASLCTLEDLKSMLTSLSKTGESAYKQVERGDDDGA